ncbi:MAG: Apolipoprotein N-acyltransferase, partial [Parcubacteria group bacterium Gr01-1014_56]
NQAVFGDVRVGCLICSELHQSDLAQRESLRSDFLLALGSDSMFPNDLSANFALAAARYRAAENGIPTIRGNIIGPSAVINADGSIQTMLPFSTSGEVRGEIVLGYKTHTQYSYWGLSAVYAFIALSLLYAAFAQVRFPRKSEQY